MPRGAKSKYTKILGALVCLQLLQINEPLLAQQHGERHAQDDTSKAANGNAHGDARNGFDLHLSSVLLPDLPMQRDGSGTSWLTDDSPIYAIHRRAAEWRLMIHGAAFVRYGMQDVSDGGTRGDDGVDAPNWLMVMAQRELDMNSQLSFRAMLTLDPLTVGGRGYPLLLQTGEAFEGEPLIDRQHPHDLFSEVAIFYGRALSSKTGVFGYLGYPGEPAIGPTAFMHRPSTRHNPNAPLSHHWQDATHITFGVATVGFRYDRFKIDGSVFTGREPNDERWGFDRPRFDSYSGRLEASLIDHLSLQFSRAFLTSPEELKPNEDQHRTVASVLYEASGRANDLWSSAVVWGMNEPIGQNESHHSILLESDLERGRQAYYARAEWVEKEADELGFEELEHQEVAITALTLGTARRLFSWGKLNLLIGGQATLNWVPDEIEGQYGATPLSLDLYLRLHPDQLHVGAMMNHEAH